MRSLSVSLMTVVMAAGMAGTAASEPRTIYDDQGRIVLEVREDGSVVSYTYDDEGRVVKSERPDGTKVEHHAESETADADQ
jgi:YD repeat-containing protein